MPSFSSIGQRFRQMAKIIWNMVLWGDLKLIFEYTIFKKMRHGVFSCLLVDELVLSGQYFLSKSFEIGFIRNEASTN